MESDWPEILRLHAPNLPEGVRPAELPWHNDDEKPKPLADRDTIRDVRKLTLDELSYELAWRGKCECCGKQPVDCYLNKTEAVSGYCEDCCRRTSFMNMIDRVTGKYCYENYEPDRKPCPVCEQRNDTQLTGSKGLVDDYCFNCAADKLCSPPIKAASNIKK